MSPNTPFPDKQRHTVFVLPFLAALVAVLAVIASLVGLLWPGEVAPVDVISVRGERVQLHGDGLYRYDTVFVASSSQGTDLVTLGLSVPLLLAAAMLSRRGSARASMVLVGAFAYFLYVYASRALSNAYNGMFLVYIAAFSASLFGVLLAGRTAASMPVVPKATRRGLAGFLFACGVVTSAVWLSPLVSSGIAGEPPKLLDTYTTSVTDVLDLGVIVPTVLVAAVLVLRRSWLGYVLAAAVIVFLVLIAATIIAGTVLQLRAGLEFTPGEVVGPISGFLVLGAVGMVLLVRLLRSVPRASHDRLTAPAAGASPSP